MNDELNKERKSKENKLQSKYRLDNLMKNIEREQEKRKERIESLQTSIKNKEDALQKRMDRVQRQSEIAEAAANENKDQKEEEWWWWCDTTRGRTATIATSTCAITGTAVGRPGLFGAACRHVCNRARTEAKGEG